MHKPHVLFPLRNVSDEVHNIMDQEEKKKRRQELLRKLHNRVDAKQAGRMNKAFKEKRVADLTEQMSNGDKQMKDNIAKVMKKVKKRKKGKMEATRMI